MMYKQKSTIYLAALLMKLNHLSSKENVQHVPICLLSVWKHMKLMKRWENTIF